jgi:hypothetical protein
MFPLGSKKNTCKKMKPPTLLNINRSQKEYLNLLLQYREYVQADTLSIFQICAFLDEVKCFWLKQLKSIEWELNELTECQTCFILSGAIFLNVSEYEHYFFKSLGNCHIISDPFSKLELIFRNPEGEINSSFTVDYFKRAFFDTLEILTTYKGYFYILPIQEIAIDDSEKHHELLDRFFWKFISSAFDEEFNSYEEFFKKYKSFEEIEAGLIDYVRKNLVFDRLSDRNLSLRQRVEKHSGEYTNITSNIPLKTDAQRFLIAVFSYITQVANILYVCSVLRINPYIRFDITFTYFTLVINIFTDDENLRRMIEKTLIGYILYRTIDGNRFENITFSEYIRCLENKSLLSSILEKIHIQKIDIFKEDAPRVARIIKNEFETILSLSQNVPNNTCT